MGVDAQAVAAAVAKQVDATITPVLATLQQIVEALAYRDDLHRQRREPVATEDGVTLPSGPGRLSRRPHLFNGDTQPMILC